MILLTDLILGYKRKNNSTIKLFDGIDIDIQRKKVTSLFGPNGCGKSTLIKYLAGYRSSGMFSNTDRKDALAQLAVGYVPQDVSKSIMSWLTGLGNVALPLILMGKGRKKSYEEAGRIANRLQLPEKLLLKHGSEMSGGERQITIIARELCRKPDVLLIDEGFASIHYKARFALMSAVRGWCREANACVLSVSHDADETAYFSDTILKMTHPPCGIRSNIEVPPSERCPQEPMVNWVTEIAKELVA